MRAHFLISLFALPLLMAQSAATPQDVYRVGPGIKPPKLTKKHQPSYTRQAYYARVQGKVVCEVIVDERGKPTNISLISPLGFGLDESALAAIRRYEFTPGAKDGQPVKVVTMVEVNFRFPGTWFDEKREKRRSTFNVAITNLTRRDKDLADQGLKSIEELARQKYLPAMHLLGRLRINGEVGPKDPDEGVALIQAASEKGHAPAMADLGMMYFEGKYAERDVDKGLQLLRDAAVYGSSDAQLFLGIHYEAGDSVPRELDRARRYFRLCAAAGQRSCQFRLAKLMFEAPERKEWEYLQAIAWFQLAADRGVTEARRIVEAELPKLTAEQMGWVRRLKPQLARGRSLPQQ